MVRESHIFKYKCTFKLNEEKTDVEIIGYNSPYPLKQDKQSIEDLKYALLERKIVDFEEIDAEKKYTAEIDCRFIETDRKGFFEQVFKLEKIEETVTDGD